MLQLCFVVRRLSLFFVFFFFNDTATTEIYTLSLHDALPICQFVWAVWFHMCVFFSLSVSVSCAVTTYRVTVDRKSTRLNSSHTVISYAVFCLKKKKKNIDVMYVLVS